MPKLIAFLLLSLPLFAQVNSARMLSGVNKVTAASYTLQPVDVSRLTTFTNVSAVSVSLLSGLNPGFGAGSIFSVVNYGAGTVTINCSSCLIYSTTNPAGSATFQLTTGQGADLYGDGVNFSANTGAGTGGGGGGFSSPMTTTGDSIVGGVAGTAARLPGPTGPNNVTEILTSTPIAGAAQTQAWLPPGMTGRAITGTTATDTILTTDCTNRVEYLGSVAVAVTLPTPTTLKIPNCVFRIANDLSTFRDVTITPTTWTINGAAIFTVHFGEVVTVYIDPNNATNWQVDVVAKPVIDVRDVSGVDCTGVNDSSAALNSLFTVLSGKTVMIPHNCKMQVTSQLVIQGQTSWKIVGSGSIPNSAGGSRIFGCSGSAGPVLYINRSGLWKMEGFDISAKGDSCSSSFTQSLQVDNTGGGGFTDTDIDIERMSFSPSWNGAKITNYIAINHTSAANGEGFRVRDSLIEGQNSLNSYGIAFTGGCCQDNAEIKHNTISRFFHGIHSTGSAPRIENNQFQSNGNFSVYGANGATIWMGTCPSPPVTIAFNEESDGGNFFNSNNDALGGCSQINMIGNVMGMSDISTTSYPINLGTFSNGTYLLMGNSINLTVTTTKNMIGSDSGTCSIGPLGTLIDIANSNGTPAAAAGWSGCTGGADFRGGHTQIASLSDALTNTPNLIKNIPGAGNGSSSIAGYLGTLFGLYNSSISVDAGVSHDPNFAWADVGNGTTGDASGTVKSATAIIGQCYGCFQPVVGLTNGPALIAHANSNASSSATTITTSAINTTGANFLVVVAQGDSATANTVTDSKSNTWTCLTKYGSGGGTAFSQICYVVNPTVGSGHTFTNSGPTYASISVQAWSGMLTTASVYEAATDVGTTGSSFSVSPGSATPLVIGDLVISGWSSGATAETTLGIDLGFVVSDPPAHNGTGIDGAMAYQFAISTAAVTPTWKSPHDQQASSGLAIFKALAPAFIARSYSLTNLVESNTAPTISSGFGTSPSIASNNGTAAFTINVGTGGSATSGVIGFPTATNGWVVHCDDLTSPTTGGGIMVKQTASSTTTATITGYNATPVATAWTASDILHCMAHAR